ncbi:TPA: hypothetical protein ACHTEY_000598 [Pseudomonas aeruginosa]
MSKELNKALELLREIRPSIPKDVLELWCKDRDAFLASHMETVEQAGGDERAVDGKPRATKCPDCGEGDLMPGDLCACGYETDPAAGYACSECDGSGDGYVGEVCRECDGSGWFVTPEQARAALAQPSGEVVVTKNESGAIVSVTRQDKEGRVLSVIAESATLTAQAEQAEAERPEVVATMYTHHDDVDFREFVVVGNCDKGCEGFYGPEKLMTVAQHERIVKAWIERWKAYIELSAKIAAQRDAAQAEVEALRAELQSQRERNTELIFKLGSATNGWGRCEKERDAAQARCAELKAELAMANDAAAKGDAARQQCGGMEMEIEELRENAAKLAAFAQEIISGALEGGSFDGADIQESAERHGLIAKQMMREPCRGTEEYCACA